MVAKWTRNTSKHAYEVGYFAKKHKLTAKLALHILAKAGPSRQKANADARRANATMKAANPKDANPKNSTSADP